MVNLPPMVIFPEITSPICNNVAIDIMQLV